MEPRDMTAFFAMIGLIVILAFLVTLLPLFYAFRLVSFISRRLSSEDIRGKVVLITGASSGIGEHLTYEYAKRGACLMIVARRENLLKKVAEKARQLGSTDVVPICADVLKVDDCRGFVEEAVSHFGRLDHVVNNAGISSLCLIEDATDITKLAPVMNVNFWGSVYPTYFAIPHLKRTKGSIFVNASAAAILSPPGMSIYSASKAALVSFYETMRVELAPEISITVANLGFIESEMTQGKQLTQGGTMEVTSDLGTAYVDQMPVMGASACAEAIVDAICWKKRFITEPKWCKTVFLLKTLFPEVMDWANRIFYFRLKANASKNAPLPSSQNKLD